jgi:hypothetical protein
MMFSEAIGCLDLSIFDCVYLVALKDHLDTHNCRDSVTSQLNAVCKGKCKLVELDKPTQSQPETVYQCIEKENIIGGICIKDSDNFFNVDLTDMSTSFVSAGILGNYNRINASNKSYLKHNNDVISYIVEKKVISDHFCTGCYFFSDVSEFLESFKELSKPNLYISDLINHLLEKGFVFKQKTAVNYIDWGTLEDWESYTSRFSTLFLDIDGVLVENSSEFFQVRWGDSKPIQENIDCINLLYDKGNTQIILTTSRKEQYRSKTEEQLKRVGLRYDHLLLGLWHGSRVIVNDFSVSNPYKSCDSINIPRDSATLNRYLNKLIRSQNV